MGCGETKNSTLPFLMCFFEFNNEKQKEFCIKLKDSCSHQKSIRYEIRESNEPFSIKLKLGNNIYNIKTVYIDNSEEEIQKTLKAIYSKLDEYFNLKNDNNEFSINLPEKEKEYDYNFNEEEIKLKAEKNKVLEKQKKLRKEKLNLENIEKITEQKTDEKINNVLEDMCIYGAATKNEIKKEKIKNPEKFIETSKALKMENEDEGIFALGLIANNLENIGIETAIESKENTSEENADLTGLQFFANGMIEKKKYDLHFEFGEERNNELLNNKNEFEKFKQNLKLKLSKDYNISPEKIIVTLPQKGSFHVQIIFQSEDFHNLNKEDFIEKFKNDPEFEELKNLKDIHEDVLMEGVKLTRNLLDPAGNRNSGWPIGEKRGGKDYDSPQGWNGIGLKVKGKYDNGDDTWIGMANVSGEWCVAYHGVGVGQSSDDVKNVVGIISKTSFKAGSRQAHEFCPDKNHPGQKVGVGVYCTPTIKTAEGYAGLSNINGINYKTVLMVRVKNEAIRQCDCISDYWVVNGTPDEIRPYRILYKKC